MPIALRFVCPIVLWLVNAASVQGEIRPDFEFDHDPEIRAPAEVKVFSRRLKALWMEALARPETDSQRMAADAIRRAHAAGFSDLDDAVSGLAAVLTAPASHPVARQAAARALIGLHAKETAPQMAASAEKYGADLRQIVEPALADWTYEPQRLIWQSRLSHTSVRRRDLVLAIRGLATTGDNSYVDALVGLAHDHFRSADVRLEAAHAAGLIRDFELESDAARLLAAGPESPQVNRLCAVKLLARHSGGPAQKLLRELAIDREPAVAAIALRRLIEIDPHLVLPLAEGAMQSADAKVRQCGADAYVLVPDPQRVVALIRLLDDPHPAVRRSVRDSLYELARRPQLSELIREATVGMLAGDRWRGLEQAGILLGALHHEPAARRLIELLEFNRPEVGIAAAWALKNLAIPETLPAMLDKATRNTEIRKSGNLPAGLEELTTHLLEAFGRTKYAAAEPLLREYLPKDPRIKYGVSSRAAAVWSLGLIHAGVPDEDLAKALTARVLDDGGPSIPPELDLVKQTAAVSIARMKAISQVATLRKYYDSKDRSSVVTTSILWAILDMTGEQIAELPPPKREMADWFLTPLDD